jgi:hypothetical protein
MGNWICHNLKQGLKSKLAPQQAYGEGHKDEARILETESHSRYIK